MKNLLCVSFFLVFLVFSCVSGVEGPADGAASELSESAVPSESPYPGPPEISTLIFQWEEAIRTRNMEMVEEMFSRPWFRYTPESGEEVAFHSYQSFESFYFDYFDRLGPLSNYSMGELSEFYVIHDDIHVYHFTHPVPGKEQPILELMGFRFLEGRWTFDGYSLILFPEGAIVSNHLMALYDTDDDGFLTDEDGGPGERYENAIWNFFEGPHRAVSHVDFYFDIDRNEEVDWEEIRRAAEILVGRGLRFSRKAFGDVIPEADTNGNGVMDDEEIDEIVELLSSPQTPSELMGPVLNTIHWTLFPDYLFQGTPRNVETYIDQLADANEDGRIDEIEQRIIDSGMREHKHVEHYFDVFLDRNKDGDVNWNEIRIMVQASAKDWGAVVLAPPPYPAHTPTDLLFDINGDSLIDDEEIKTHVILFSGQPAAAAFITEELKFLLDTDGDRVITASEIRKLKSEIFYPRSVNEKRALDGESDEDDNGYLDVVEIGLPAGEAAGTPVTSFDDRILMYRAKMEASGQGGSMLPGSNEFREQMGDQFLAVLDIEPGMSSIEQDVAEVLTIFVENAFVNLGSVTLVERRNLEQVFEEIEFQLSGMVDDRTAVEIGEMTGADIIALGELNELDDRYFLNIKVLAVESSEILGSSISQTDTPEDFLNMANEVVNKLF